MTRTLTSQEAADMIGVNKNIIYKLAQRGEIPCVRIGNKYIFTAESLENWLTKSVEANARFDTAQKKQPS